jgi:hypothetical protein
MDGSEEKGSCVSEADCMGLNREREKGGGGVKGDCGGSLSRSSLALRDPEKPRERLSRCS